MFKTISLMVFFVFTVKAYGNVNIEQYLETSIPGRCHYTDEPMIKTAAALFVTNVNGQVQIAPLSADQFSKDYFDQKSYVELLKLHGNTLFSLAMPTHKNSEVVIIEKEERDNFFRAVLKEENNVISLSASKNGQIFRVCTYSIRLRK